MHRLLILSQHADDYLRLIRTANLPGLSITATSEPEKGALIGTACDIVFGEPSLISRVITEIPGLLWVQSSWAGVEPLPPEHILWCAPNVRITFHTAALSVPEDIVQIFLDNYRRLLQGESLHCQVDFERGY